MILDIPFVNVKYRQGSLFTPEGLVQSYITVISTFFLRGRLISLNDYHSCEISRVFMATTV